VSGSPNSSAVANPRFAVPNPNLGQGRNERANTEDLKDHKEMRQNGRLALNLNSPSFVRRSTFDVQFMHSTLPHPDTPILFLLACNAQGVSGSPNSSAVANPRFAVPNPNLGRGQERKGQHRRSQRSQRNETEWPTSSKPRFSVIRSAFPRSMFSLCTPTLPHPDTPILFLLACNAQGVSGSPNSSAVANPQFSVPNPQSRPRVGTKGPTQKISKK
jgi:hypothetical protein